MDQVENRCPRVVVDSVPSGIVVAVSPQQGSILDLSKVVRSADSTSLLSQAKIKTTMDPPCTESDPDVHAVASASLDFLRPQGSIYCQINSILPRAISRFKIEENLLSNTMGIASL